MKKDKVKKGIRGNLKWAKLSTLRLAEGSEVGLLRVLVRNFEARFDKKLKMMGILS